MKINTWKMVHKVGRIVSLTLAIILVSGVGARLSAEIKSLAIGQNANGSLQLFASDPFCITTVFTCSQLVASGNWGSWHSLPANGLVVQYAIGRNADGRLEVFMLRKDGRCLHFWQENAGGDFTGGRDIGAVDWEQIAIAHNADGRLELFALVRGNIYHLWQTELNGGWSTSAPFGTVGVTQMAVANKAGGRLEVFALVGGNIYHFGQTEPKGEWSTSAPFGTVGVTQMAVASYADGRLEVFALVDGNIYHFGQTEPNGGWSTSAPFGTVGVTQMAVASKAGGRLEVFALVGGNIYHFGQTEPNGDWSTSAPFGTVGVTQMAVASKAGGRLEVFALAGGNIYRFGQTEPNGKWSQSVQFPDPEPAFKPRIHSFTATPLNSDRARLDWNVESSLCCSIEIVGRTNFYNLDSTGSREVWRECPCGGDYQYKLTAKCGKQWDDKTIPVPNNCKTSQFCFRLMNPVTLGCSTVSQSALNVCAAEQEVRKGNPNVDVMAIDCSQTSKACSQ